MFLVAVLAVGGLALHAGLLRLDRVGQLVRDESVAFLRAGSELTRAEVHVAAGCERASAELVSRRFRVTAGVHLDMRQICPELRLHSRAQIIGERGTTALGNLGAALRLSRRLALHMSFARREQAHVAELGPLDVVLIVVLLARLYAPRTPVVAIPDPHLLIIGDLGGKLL
ncbi:MAG TPA: hypothetical protein VGL86_26690 [Polyangia bacterium]